MICCIYEGSFTLISAYKYFKKKIDTLRICLKFQISQISLVPENEPQMQG